MRLEELDYSLRWVDRMRKKQITSFLNDELKSQFRLELLAKMCVWLSGNTYIKLLNTMLQMGYLSGKICFTILGYYLVFFVLSSHTWSLIKPPSVWNSHVWRPVEEEEARQGVPPSLRSITVMSDWGWPVSWHRWKAMWRDMDKRDSVGKCDSDAAKCFDAAPMHTGKT